VQIVTFEVRTYVIFTWILCSCSNNKIILSALFWTKISCIQYMENIYSFLGKTTFM